MIDPFPCFYSHLKRRSPLYCPKGRNIPYVWRLFSLPDQISYRQSRPASRILLHSLCWVSSMVGRAAFSPTLMRNLMPSLHISYGNGELKPWPFWGQSVSLLLDKWHITRQSFQRNSSSAGPQVTLLCINHPCLNSPGSLHHRVTVSGNETFSVKAAPNNPLHASGEWIQVFSKRSDCRAFLWVLSTNCYWENSIGSKKDPQLMPHIVAIRILADIWVSLAS